MAKQKESFLDQFFQQRLPALRLSWKTNTLIIIFSVFTVLFAVISIPLLVIAGNAYEQVIMYDGYDMTNGDCHISENNEGKKCTIEFQIEKDISKPLAVYYYLDNFYQNHREYVNSVNYKQLHGTVLEGKDLESDCGSKTYADEAQTKVLVPCGYIANSFFNDVITVQTDGVVMNEHGISFEPDQQRFQNPEGYGEASDKFQYIYETYPQIPKDKSDDITKSNYNGGGVMDEHFIVWMRLAGIPKFQKLYGRLEGKDFKKGDTIKFEITNNFEVSSFEGKKGLVIATENAIGGKNYGIGITYLAAAVVSLIITVAIIIVKKRCPKILPSDGNKYD